MVSEFIRCCSVSLLRIDSLLTRNNTMLALKVKTWSADTHKNKEIDSQGSVAIVVTSEELGKHVFPTVVDLDIIAKDGSRARFFISAKVKNGRPVAEISVNRGNGSTRKSVTGSFSIKPKD